MFTGTRGFYYWQMSCISHVSSSSLHLILPLLPPPSPFTFSADVALSVPHPSFFYTFSLFGWNACVRACQSVSLEAQSSPVPGADTQVVDPVTVPVFTPSRAQAIRPSGPRVCTEYDSHLAHLWVFLYVHLLVYLFIVSSSMLVSHRVCSLARSP